MTKIPDAVKDVSLVTSLRPYLIHQGKVRDTYDIPTESNTLVVVATDRISIFDFVLPVTVPCKGEVLTALTHFWMTQALDPLRCHLKMSEDNSNHVKEIKHFYKDLPLERALAVKKLEIMPYELIFRAHLGGSVWKSYEKTGLVAGLEMPTGLVKWQKLDAPLFTPSTKAEKGHDENITQREFFRQTGELGWKGVELALKSYKKAYKEAFKNGIIILDTKFEIGIDIYKRCYLADEVLTPDSSRFTTVNELSRALLDKKDPDFYDKEPVRQWGKTVATPFVDDKDNKIVGINKLDPNNPEHLHFVHNISVPEEVVEDTVLRYLDIFKKITGVTLHYYQEYLL